MTATSIGSEQLFRMPDLGEGLTEAEITEWRVAVGDTVEIDQIVVEVETAKAAVEVPVPYAGTVVRLHAEAGASVGVGEPLISVGAAALPPAPEDSAQAAAAQYREEEQAGSGNVLIGYGTGHAPTARRRRRRGTPAASTSAPTTAPAAASPAGHAGADGLAPRVISPLVRKLAREKNVDITALVPSGPYGVIQRRDVERAVTQAVDATSADPGTAVADRQDPVVERIPLRGLRRAVADKLSRSRREIPDATTWVDADATALLETKNVLQAADPDQGIGLLALLARICVAGLRRHPELNSTVDTDNNEIVRFPHVNLGFAAQTERGLVVPVIRDAHLLTTAQMAAEFKRLTGLARSGSLPPDCLTGGTFTLNNYGVFGVDGSSAIINHPEAAIVGFGRVIDKPWVVGGALAVRKVVQISLSFDHRVCDGGVAGGFLRYVADRVESPTTLLADV
ncbi:2-oxo acid dehydrogenase subunit E2 [Streptomyces sp. GMY02]|uniref:dihydrolipoamide acetyltransferase family protein n=1 Tax=Streptomyces sp. GMY02 TaxID=1333528 RepID=UPI001C2CA495|nr:dihydrolipoamide acetyltransferase family protein [Streptomyces sp. GMY02]QXE33764.1 2-oxo acid dehydrogenase subunit E2 [Streptomyces sp. GMY02]